MSLLRRSATLTPLSALILLLCSGPLQAQRTTADILGTVADVSGAVLPGVQITVHNLDTAADSSTISDKNGEYVVTQLPVGRYSIRATSSGFKTWTVPK